MYAVATLWNGISNDGLENIEHVDDFRKELKHLFKNTFKFDSSTQPVRFPFGPHYIKKKIELNYSIAYCCVSFFSLNGYIKHNA